MIRMFQTEYVFKLPKGFVDEDGNLQREGTMRLATAADEILPLKDPTNKKNQPNLKILILSRVITKLGNIRKSEITPRVIGKLSPSDLAYLHEFNSQVNGVRWLFLFLERSIDQATQWVVFEPNNEKLWDRVTQTITQFLTQVWREGALMGTKAEEAFFVKCGRTTMTQNDIDNGKLIVMIGVAPVKPAEFVIFRIAQWTGDAKS